MAPPREDEEVHCNCKLKPYDPDDPSTWERPKYANLHDADKDCCKTPIFTVEKDEKPPVPLFDSDFGLSDIDQAPSTETPTCRNQQASAFDSCKLSGKPTTVGGKLVPNRLCAIELAATKENRSFTQLSTFSTSPPARVITSSATKSHITYSRRDRLAYGNSSALSRKPKAGRKENTMSQYFGFEFPG